MPSGRDLPKRLPISEIAGVGPNAKDMVLALVALLAEKPALCGEGCGRVAH